ncbi:TetR/AcrR family transcriptional regulator [Nocardia cyriacigeorgica]|uniref:TetR/AcrR family transcriptional regulator n=2 Tax=Nocardia cyriacigeorgica TaxID=135487 RepID=UPI000CEA1A85|nr:TetR/AcrR family transcriptional regulator [Nocardia cyriacigeorgica]AVH24697.1 TetR family transcriptional regulator [Nocardia cyriacigeorgica]PPJ01431.1 TetR family transcriptional regulator [Nocardia cyriacigeorgica]
MPRRSQEDRSRATRTALEEAGLRLFTERGFAGTSAEELVSAAGVTRGALHHHYGDKRGLFLAVLEQLESDATAEITQAIAAADPDDPLTAMATGLATFLEICRRPSMVRIALSDAPAVLGWQAWREFEAEHGLGVIIDQLERAREAGLITDVPVRVLAQLILSAVAESGLIVAHAEDPDTARMQAQQSLMLLVAGILRTG